MGYSASITCKSEKAKDEMWAFMEKHYQDTSVALQTGLRARYSGLVSGGGIKYGGNVLSLGFNSPHDYEFALLRWMALRVGKRRKFLKTGIDTAVPWVNNDNQSSIPVLRKDQWPDAGKELEQYLVDEHGFQPYQPWWPDGDDMYLSFVARYANQDQLIGVALHRLSTLWESR